MRVIPIIGLLSLLSACEPEPRQQQIAPASDTAKKGRVDRSKAKQMAPDIVFEDPDGEPVTLQDFKGKPLLLNLWATWCAPCIIEMPTLDTLGGRNKNIKVLAVSQDLEGRVKVDPFFDKAGFRELEPYLDSRLNLMMELGVRNLPTTILFDAEGREVWRMTGVEDWTGARAAELISEASAEKNGSSVAQ